MNKKMAGSTRKNVTIRDVAREAGVAISTVSYALSGKAALSGETRARVLAAVEKLGYQARSSRGRAGPAAALPVLGLLVPGGPDEPPRDYHYLAEMVRGMTSVTQDFGYLVTVLYRTVTNVRLDWQTLCRQGRVQGLVVSSPFVRDEAVEALAAEGFPMVLLQGGPSPTGVPTAGIDNVDGAFRATEHLIVLGHPRVAMLLPGPLELDFSLQRLDGYRQALEAYGVPFDPALVRNGELSEQAAEQVTGVLLDLPERPTALFAGNDTQAIGAIRAARARGLSVPGDLAVVGFDDIAAAHQGTPPLSTMRSSDYRILAESTRILIRRIMRPEIKAKPVLIRVELVIRESCGARA
jgi:LacI family transcriptional regulator